ncbi:MAG: hypothetical protein R3C03_11655 [Pirellulaceae bacterium]
MFRMSVEELAKTVGADDVRSVPLYETAASALSNACFPDRDRSSINWRHAGTVEMASARAWVASATGIRVGSLRSLTEVVAKSGEMILLFRTLSGWSLDSWSVNIVPEWVRSCLLVGRQLVHN